MKNNKTPGLNGFTVEFFKVFFQDLGIYMVRSMNCAYENGKLSNYFNIGIITLLPQGNKPRHFIKNWRPISVLNVVYKILLSCIAYRIKKVLARIIHANQSGFLPGRFIGENIRIIYDIIAYTEKENIPGMILLIDFEKAFDMVSHQFLYKILSFVNFGHSFMKWINVLYNNANSSVMVNGQITPRFKIERGCRQGDPLSPYLFLLCIEILGIII